MQYLRVVHWARVPLSRSCGAKQKANQPHVFRSSRHSTVPGSNIFWQTRAQQSRAQIPHICAHSSANSADAFYTFTPLSTFAMKAFFMTDTYLLQKVRFSFGPFDAQTHGQTSIFEDIIQNIASLPPTKTREQDMPKSTKTIEWINMSGGPVGSLKSCSGWNNSST